MAGCHDAQSKSKQTGDLILISLSSTFFSEDPVIEIKKFKFFFFGGGEDRMIV